MKTDNSIRYILLKAYLYYMSNLDLDQISHPIESIDFIDPIDLYY